MCIIFDCENRSAEHLSLHTSPHILVSGLGEQKDCTGPKASEQLHESGDLVQARSASVSMDYIFNPWSTQVERSIEMVFMTTVSSCKGSCEQ